MFLIDVVLVVFLSLLFTWLLVGAMGRRHGDRDEALPTALLVFLLLFFFVWAGGVWITPFGPALYGTFWLPFVFMALFVTLLLAVAIPARPPRTVREAVEEEQAEAAMATVFGVFFWILVLGLLASVIYRYAAV